MALSFEERDNLVREAQDYVAEAMLAFQLQLRACFKGDYEEVKRQASIADRTTSLAIQASRKLIYR